MRIYNKKTFVAGIFMLVLAALLLIPAVSGRNLTAKDVILAAALFLFGASSLMRSLSRDMTKEDRVEEWDERNQLSELKAKSKAFQISQTVDFALLIITLAAAKLTGYEGFVGIALGLAFACAVSMFTHLFVYIYCEKRS